MTKYRRSKNRRKKAPVWKTQRFLRIHGFADSVFRKVGLKEKTYGGWFERQKRELAAYESAVVCYLQTYLAPILLAYRKAETAALCFSGSERNAPPTSTGEARKRREQLAAVQNAAALRQQILSAVCSSCAQIEQAFQKANTGVAVYTKATRFSPLEEEIPRFVPSYGTPQTLLSALGIHGEYAAAQASREDLASPA